MPYSGTPFVNPMTSQSKDIYGMAVLFMISLAISVFPDLEAPLTTYSIYCPF
jgi:hypothetical protein